MLKKYSENKKEKIKNPKINDLSPLIDEPSGKYLNENILQNINVQDNDIDIGLLNDIITKKLSSLKNLRLNFIGMNTEKITSLYDVLFHIKKQCHYSIII